jgi:hypothetical protein
MKQENFRDITHKRFQSFSEHIDSSSDLTLIILKSHLIAEEIISAMIDAKCTNPEYLTESYISFSIKLKLLKALYGDQLGLGRLWKPLENLNELRNELAHKISSPKASTKKEKLVASLPPSFIKKNGSINEKINFAINNILSMLAAIEMITLSPNKDEAKQFLDELILTAKNSPT